VAIPADIPESLEVSHIRRQQLPVNWRRYPAPEGLPDFGTRWARAQRTAVLAVPSVVIPEELNYLVNPRHPAFKNIRIGQPQPFSLDPRLWQR